eukprot:533772-Pelagomonas_calceolata.AAC.1
MSTHTQYTVPSQRTCSRPVWEAGHQAYLKPNSELAAFEVESTVPCVSRVKTSRRSSRPCSQLEGCTFTTCCTVSSTYTDTQRGHGRIRGGGLRDMDVCVCARAWAVCKATHAGGEMRDSTRCAAPVEVQIELNAKCSCRPANAQL